MCAEQCDTITQHVCTMVKFLRLNRGVLMGCWMCVYVRAHCPALCFTTITRKHVSISHLVDRIFSLNTLVFLGRLKAMYSWTLNSAKNNYTHAVWMNRTRRADTLCVGQYRTTHIYTLNSTDKRRKMLFEMSVRRTYNKSIQSSFDTI